jgi:hypothetical protein
MKMRISLPDGVCLMPLLAPSRGHPYDKRRGGRDVDGDGIPDADFQDVNANGLPDQIDEG